jgi:hypothetical protein
MTATLQNPIRQKLMKGRSAFFFIVLICMTSCSTTMLKDYLPKSDLDSVAAEKVIRRALEEQPWEYRPKEIKFSEDALRITVVRYRFDGNFHREPNGEIPINVYYDSLGKTKVVRKRGRFVLTITNRRGELLRNVFLPDETEAKNFLDALESLRSRSVSVAPKN